MTATTRSPLMVFIEESNRLEYVTDPYEHTLSLAAWEYLAGELDGPRKWLTKTKILCTHRLIMEHSWPARLLPDKPGRLRRQEVCVRWGGHVSPCPPATQVSDLLDIWIKEFNAGNSTAKHSHTEFEKIHPFADGNGRVGRMLMRVQEVRQGVPLTLIRADDSAGYYSWFR